jgi:glycosyltransferase involved in cell wall biosynthesis
MLVAQSVIFLVSSVTGNQLTRAYPFASLLKKKDRNVKIIGPGRTDRDVYIQDPELEIQRIPKTSISGRVEWIRDQISDYDVLCVCKPCLEGTIAAALAKRLGKKLVYDIDDDDLRTWFFDMNQDAKRLGLLRSMENLPDGLAIGINFRARILADRILVASEFLRRRFGGEVVYVPVSGSIYHRPDIPGKKIVMYAGAIRAHKGIELLIDAYSLIRERVPRASLYLVGPVEKTSRSWRIIQARIKGLPGVHLPGKQPIQSIPEWLSKADCLVIPSPNNPIHRAQSPVKLMYYMASGRPIVSTQVGEVPIILENGRSGILTEDESPKSLADSISKVLESPQLSRSLAMQARDDFLARFSSEATADRIDSLFSFGGK